MFKTYTNSNLEEMQIIFRELNNVCHKKLINYDDCVEEIKKTGICTRLINFESIGQQYKIIVTFEAGPNSGYVYPVKFTVMGTEVPEVNIILKHLEIYDSFIV